VSEFKVSPKPDGNGEIHFAWSTTFRGKEAYLRVYTSGFRLVWEEDFSNNNHPEYLDAGSHEITWNCKDEEGRAMPPDEYLCFISVSAGKKTYDSSGKTEIP
jgi:flagellar hook assembly protein FlgD